MRFSLRSLFMGMTYVALVATAIGIGKPSLPSFWMMILIAILISQIRPIDNK